MEMRHQDPGLLLPETASCLLCISALGKSRNAIIIGGRKERKKERREGGEEGKEEGRRKGGGLDLLLVLDTEQVDFQQPPGLEQKDCPL